MTPDAEQEALEGALAKGCEVPGAAAMAAELRAALDQGRLAWLRRALSCYLVRKVREA